MKKNIFGKLFLIGLLSISWNALEAQDNMELRLEFEQNLTDQSASNRIIKAYNREGIEDNTVITYVNDEVRGSVAYIAKDETYTDANGFSTGVGYLEVDGWTGLAANPRSVAMWVKTTDDNELLLGWGGSTHGTCIAFNILGGKLRLEVIGGGVTGSTIINDDQWHHVAFVLDENAFDITDVKLYVDGKLETPSASASYTLGTSEDVSVRLGIDPRVHSHRFFFGYMDDVRIYSKTLTPTEISELASTSTSIAEPSSLDQIKIISGEGNIIVQYEGEKSVKAEVIDLGGQQQRSQSILPGSNNITVKGGQIYLVKVIGNGKAVTKKVWVK